MKAVSVFPKGILLTVCLEAASIVAGVLSHSRSHLSQYMMAVSLNIAVVFFFDVVVVVVAGISAAVAVTVAATVAAVAAAA